MLSAHQRLLIGVAFAVVAWVATLALHAPAGARFLIAWNVGAGAFLILTWWLFIRADEAKVRERAAKQDEGRGVILALSMVAIAASLVGIVSALTSLKSESATTHGLVEALAGLTLVSSWFVLHSLFVGHYAHRHFAEIDASGEKAAFLFPGAAPATYLDFAYLAICVGATAQVSDPGVQSTRLRNLVTVHAVMSFFYNTAVLALGINILSGLIPH